MYNINKRFGAAGAQQSNIGASDFHGELSEEERKVIMGEFGSTIERDEDEDFN